MERSTSCRLLHFRWCWKRLICSVLALAGWMTVNAQARLQAWASYDSSALVELFNSVPIGIRLRAPGGVNLATRGFLGGRLPWKELKVISPQGEVRNGTLSFNRRQVAENGHRIDLIVRFAGDTAHAFLSIPYVTKLRFNLYTDSLKRDNPLDLNVEGLFSSGRIYPLDTAVVSYKVSAGKLEGKSLLVTSQDTGVHQVHIRAWLKADPRLRDQMTVPVKILPDTAELPSERELLDKWKKRRRR